MLEPQNRRLSWILIAAALLLLVAIAVGKRMGDRVITKATEQGQTGVGTTLTYSPAPNATDAGPMGPNWKKSQVLAAATDPGFPDPRVPPTQLPTPPPTPKPTPKPKPTPTPSATPSPVATPTSPFYKSGPSITPAPIPTNAKNLPTPEASPILGPSSPPLR